MKVNSHTHTVYIQCTLTYTLQTTDTHIDIKQIHTRIQKIHTSTHTQTSTHTRTHIHTHTHTNTHKDTVNKHILKKHSYT